MILEVFYTVTCPMRCWAFQQYCFIVIHPFLQAVVISGWLLRAKKGRGFGIRQHSFLLSDTESVKNLSLCSMSKFDIPIKLYRPWSHILKVQIQVSWNSVSSRPNKFPFHLQEFLFFLHLNFTYFFRYFLTCWSVCGRYGCFGIQGHTSKRARIVCL